MLENQNNIPKPKPSVAESNENTKGKICPVMSNHKDFNLRPCEREKFQLWINQPGSCGLIGDKVRA